MIWLLQSLPKRRNTFTTQRGWNLEIHQVHAQFVLFPYADRTSFTPIKKPVKVAVLYILIFRVFQM
jgi:hypothetical protein